MSKLNKYIKEWLWIDKTQTRYDEKNDQILFPHAGSDLVMVTMVCQWWLNFTHGWFGEAGSRSSKIKNIQSIHVFAYFMTPEIFFHTKFIFEKCCCEWEKMSTRGLSAWQLRCLIVYAILMISNCLWYTAKLIPNDLDLTFQCHPKSNVMW